MTMRLYSTPQSALQLEATKLAIIEVAFSLIIYIGIELYFGTMKHLIFAIAIAPLMLFRTEISADWGLHAYMKMMYYVDYAFIWLGPRNPSNPLNIEGSKDTAFATLAPKATLILLTKSILIMLWYIPILISRILYAFIFPLVAVVIRVVATVYCGIRHPLYTFKDMPNSWLRQTLCVDLFHPPELLPMESVRSDLELPTFSTFMSNFRSKPSSKEKFDNLVFLLPALLIGYIPSLIYRISFKATAIVYAPFIWVCRVTLRSTLTTKVRLERITKGELEKIRRGLSWIIIVALLMKIGLLANWLDRSYINSKFLSPKLVEIFFLPGRWPWWQITLAADASLTFLLLFFADAALARIDCTAPWTDEMIDGILSTTSFARATLSILTMSHFFLLAVNNVILLL